MKKIIIVGVIASIIALVIAAPYIKEHKVYKKAMKDNLIESCDDYIYKYPDGKHLDEVLEKKETIAFEQVQSSLDESTCDWYAEEFPEGKHLEDVRYLKISCSEVPFTAANEYLHDFPQGKYADAVNAFCDSLWDAEIQKYNSRDKSRESAEAVRFMSEMLQYMKTHRLNCILVDVTSHLELKDYDEYDKKIRDLLDLLNDSRLSLESGMISLKSNFSAADVSSLMEILSEGVQSSLDKMFTPGFFIVKCSSDEPSSIDAELPKLHFDYTIKNQEDKIEEYVFPHIWNYSENNVVKNYLLGISILFNAHYSIPGSSTSFDYSEKGEPAKNISNIDDIQDGYRRMTSLCFAQFSDKMAQNMGLKETYFENE